MIFVFDIETIPDVTLVKQFYGVESDGLEACEEAMRIQEEKSGSSFLPPVFHQVVAIAGVACDDFGRFKGVGNLPRDKENPSEKELIESFLAYLDQSHPRLVSFNGRGFDIPVLMLRALRYNLSCPAFYENDNPEHNKNKWENYRQRYSERFHIDLLDAVGHYGAARGMKLDQVCGMAGMPGKYDVSGDQVMELFYQNDLEKIREYCESDVLNTYWLFLKYERLKGNLSLDDYANILQEWQEKMPAGRSYSEVFVESIIQELQGI